MNALSGYKTTIVSIVAIVASVASMLGLDLDIGVQAAVVTAAMGILGVALNFKRSLAKAKEQRNPHGPMGTGGAKLN